MSVGWALVREILSSGATQPLLPGLKTIRDIWDSFQKISRISGYGARERKRMVLEAVFGGSSELEREWLLRLLSGEMRHGVNRGLLLDALAELAGVTPERIRLADMFLGDLMRLTSLAVGGMVGEASPKLFTPFRPMLAEMAVDVSDALNRLGGRAFFSPKYDGVRVQIHKDGGLVRIYTRRLQEITESIQDVVAEAVEKVSARTAILDGEVYGVGEDGRPLPFQETMRRVGRERDAQKASAIIPLNLKVFDVIYLDDVEVWHKPLWERLSLLERAVGPDILAPTLMLSDISEAERFFHRCLGDGFEGVMAKAANSPYTPGRRGGYWLKVKKVEYLDVVIVAAEWGHGRRRGWLSNYHLAVRDGRDGSLKMVGKTFKGLTDEGFGQMTRRLLSLKKAETEWGVVVEPVTVVEVAYSEVQRSPFYDSGYALRFARIRRVRDDKGPSEIDTLEKLERLYKAQGGGGRDSGGN